MAPDARPFSRILRSVVAGLLFVTLLAFVTPARAAVVARSAADVCAASADPCFVTQEVDVVPGSHLDFGLRTLRVQGSGLLDFGSGDATVDCGRLELSTSGVAWRLRGAAAGVGTAGGEVTVTVRGRCRGDSGHACLDDADCSASESTCDASAASALVDGAIFGNADVPGTLRLRSAGSLVLTGNVSLDGSGTSSDGGAVELESTLDSVDVAGLVDVAGGAFASGGSIDVRALRDITLRQSLTATGGDYDGGSIALDAGRDLAVLAELRADANAGAGVGGEIDAVAGRDILIDGGGSSNNLVISNDGHQSSENIGGDGGTQSWDAGRDLRVGRWVRFHSSGASPDGFADTLSFGAEGSIAFDGAVVAKARGAAGGGGLVELLADGEVTLAATAFFDLTGAAAGGDFDVECGGGFASAAAVDVRTGASGVGGRVVVTAGGDASVDAPWTTSGADNAFSLGELRVDACHARIGAALRNSAFGGRNRITVRESLEVAASASVVASGSGGSNVFRHRSSDKPPRLLGSVSPAPQIVADATLAGCPVCGNGEIDWSEGCDDGNLASGDACSPRCQDEGCERESIDYPQAPLCNDGNECRSDRCDSALHRCMHDDFDCSDGIDCTDDSCSGMRCLHLPQQARCDDGEACTDDVCSGSSGCRHDASAGACDDGVFCNGGDSCRDGSCSVHAGDPCAGGEACADTCDETADSCLSPAGSECADDGNACSDDACDGAGHCLHHANLGPCDDGLYCNGSDRCSEGACAWHAGNPCRSDCADLCDEAAGACRLADAGDCPDDGNPCTAERCAGGACLHEAIDAACDDGDFCSSGERCREGACEAAPPVAVDVRSLQLRRTRSGELRLLLSAELPMPEEWPALRIVLRGEDGAAFVDTTIAANAFRGSGDRWALEQGQDGIEKLRLQRDPHGSIAKLRLRMDRAPELLLAEPAAPRLSVVFAEQPDAGFCASSAVLVCETLRSGLRCAAPAIDTGAADAAAPLDASP